MSFLKEKFDVVVCLETVEHIFNLDKLFMFFNYLLEKNGFLLISTPNMASFQAKLFYVLKGYLFGENHHVRFLTKSRLNQYAFFNAFDLVTYNNYFSFHQEIIKRGFEVRNKYLVYFLTGLFFAPLFLFSKIKIADSISNSGIVVLFKKANLPPCGLELENFKVNFGKLNKEEKILWIERIKQFIKRDRMGEHIYFRDYLFENIIK